MSECFQEQESATAPVSAGIDDLSGESLDHRVDGFDLPPLPVAAVVQVTFHLLAIAARRLPRGRPAMLCRDQRLDPEFLAGQFVVGFAVEAGVRKNRLQSDAGLRFDQQGAKVAEVRLRPPGWPEPPE